MTKQQAYELAQQELPNCVYYEIKDRAIEIYAGAFLEWGNDNTYYCEIEPDGRKVWVDALQMDLKRYTLDELIIEFEKNTGTKKEDL